MTRATEKLRITTLPGGAQQVCVAELGDAETASAHHIEDSYCRRCGQRIGRRPFHQVNALYYHTECAHVF